MYLRCLTLNLPSTRERTVDFSHDCVSLLSKLLFMRCVCELQEVARKHQSASRSEKLSMMLKCWMMKGIRLGRREWSLQEVFVMEMG